MRRLLVALLLLALPVAVRAQSLGEIAEKEKQKKKSGPPATVFTNEDLEKHAADRPKTPDKPAAAPKQDLSADHFGEEKQWRSRASKLRADLAAAEKAVADKQAEIDQRNSGLTQEPVNDPMMYQTLETQRQQTLQALEVAKAAVVQAQKAIEAFEETARQKNIPPGWLRE